jgi:hypothetical protein
MQNASWRRFLALANTPGYEDRLITLPCELLVLANISPKVLSVSRIAGDIFKSYPIFSLRSLRVHDRSMPEFNIYK